MPILPDFHLTKKNQAVIINEQTKPRAELPPNLVVALAAAMPGAEDHVE